MDYKEKTKELIDKYYLPHPFTELSINFALIAVNEMLNEYPSQCPKDSYEMERHLFWKQVKQELQNYEE